MKLYSWVINLLFEFKGTYVWIFFLNRFAEIRYSQRIALAFQNIHAFNLQEIWEIFRSVSWRCRKIVSAVWWVRQFTIATSDDATILRYIPYLSDTLHTRHPLYAIDIYGAIYILPNILSLSKWPRARAKLLNIQAGNEAKFVCVSACSRHWYTSGSSSSALLPDCILSRYGIMLQCTVTRACSHARTDLRTRITSKENLTLSFIYIHFKSLVNCIFRIFPVLTTLH